MRFIVTYTALLLACSFLNNLPAQVHQPYRYEKEQKFGDEDFTVISLEENGLALVRETRHYKGGNRTWELILLDTILNERQHLDVEIDQRKTLIGYEYDSTNFYLLFKSGESIKTILDLVEINIRTAEIKQTEIKPELAVNLTHFSKVGNNFVFGGYVNNEPAVLLYLTDQQNMKVVPGFFQKETELVELRGNKNSTFSVILIDRSQRDNRKLLFKIFDSQGKELLDDIITIEGKRSLQTAIVSSLVRDDLILLGTWGGLNSKQSAGFYGVPVDPFTEQPITYTAFADMTNYLQYLKEAKRKRIVEKTKVALQAGKIPDFINFIRPVRITEYDKGFLLLAEVFIPSSSTAPFRDNYPYYAPYPTPYSYYGPYFGNYPSYYNRMYNPFYTDSNTMRPADDIKITRSILVSFTPKGEVAWDQTLELDNIRLSALEQVSDFCLISNNLYFIYKKESDLRLKKVNLETGEVSELTERIRMKSETDELRSERDQSGALRYWYNTGFYVWGVQTIRNTTSKEEGAKRVFYVNKVAIR
ncbi:MAG: hypothetical protein HRU69_07850 [Flammeovirgaceae bacterium]|nr:MAG: hypothetical protein HRU69_07850 [Flammeovirgaceae bacterium]